MPKRKYRLAERENKGFGADSFSGAAHFQHDVNWSSICSPHFGQVHMAQEEQVK
jgi:hypothetical protein